MGTLIFIGNFIFLMMRKQKYNVELKTLIINGTTFFFVTQNREVGIYKGASLMRWGDMEIMHPSRALWYKLEIK